MRKITLMARIRKAEGEYVFERVVTERKGKPVPPMEPENATHYYFRYTEKAPGAQVGKQVMKSAGVNFAEAVKMLRAKEIELECVARGVDVPPPAADNRVTVAAGAEQFIKNQSTLGKSTSTVYGYTRAVTQFKESCFRVYLDEVTQQDILDHIAWLRKNVPSRAYGQREGMLRTRLNYIKAFFLHYELKMPLPQKQWPKLEERKVEAYTTEQIQKLLSKATDDEHDLILFFLCTGLRDDEAAHAVYDDVNWKARTVKVGPKPEIGYTTKNGREREILIPGDLLDRIRERRARNPQGALIFPNRNGGADSSLLGRVRQAAARAGFTGRVTLHKFRKTFGTRYGEKHGVVNAQILLGHESIVTTQKYLAETKIARSAVEALFEDVVGK